MGIVVTGMRTVSIKKNLKVLKKLEVNMNMNKTF